MKQLKIVLPDAAYLLAEKEAKKLEIEVTAYCANLLIDSLLGVTKTFATKPDDSGRSAPRVPLTRGTTPNGSGPQAANSSGSDFASIFHGYPERSRRYAEAIYDEAMKIPGVTVESMNPRKGEKSVMFRPNFLVIEYLLSKGTRAGIAISLGASRNLYRNPPNDLKAGRTESYSRILIETDEALKKCLPLIRETYDLRYNRGGPSFTGVQTTRSP
ncbi:MAG: hypothetical protein WBQ86_07060 [Candidatus Binatus sp.]